MRKTYYRSLLIILLFLIFLTACSTSEINLQQNDPEEDLEEKMEEALFLQDDFTLSIGTLPYRGAVLYIAYEGETDLSEYELNVDIASKGVVTQRDMQTEEVDGYLISEIVDLMYIPRAELEFVLKVKNDDGELCRYNYVLVFERYYSWKDWMLADGEWFSIINYSPNFKYDFPGCTNNLGAHSSWDIMTSSGQAVPVYSGTIGFIFRIISEHENLEVYNPYVGAIVQYGHTTPKSDIYVGKKVMPGEHISYVIPKAEHIHYSIIRPYRYVLKISEDGYRHYMPIISNETASGDGRFIYHDSYKDPFYFHEPTTLGYWNEESLPAGLKEEMLSSFKRDNPNVILPAELPLD